MLSVKKKSFLLFEILLAILLIGGFLTIWVNRSFTTGKKEIESLYLLEQKRCADLAFANLQEKLLNRQISWHELDNYFYKEKVFLILSGKPAKEIPLSCQIKSSEKKAKDGLYKKLTVNFLFSDSQKFTYKMIVKKPNDQ